MPNCFMVSTSGVSRNNGRMSLAKLRAMQHLLAKDFATKQKKVSGYGGSVEGQPEGRHKISPGLQSRVYVTRHPQPATPLRGRDYQRAHRPLPSCPQKQ